MQHRGRGIEWVRVYARTFPQRFLFNTAVLAQEQLQRIIRYYETPTAYDSHREDLTTDAQWKIYMSNFLMLGEPLKFAANKMIAAGILARPEWDIYTEVAQDSKILLKINTPGKKKTVWHPGIVAGSKGMNTLRHTRELIKFGIIPIIHLTRPKATPPTLLIARSTAAQPTQHSQKRIRATWLTQARALEAKTPMLMAQTQPPQPTTPDWLKRKGDLLWTQLHAYQYDVNIESAKLYDDAPVFLLYFRQATVDQVLALREVMAECIGVADVVFQFASGRGQSLYAWVSG